jgi:hypothetical protein
LEIQSTFLSKKSRDMAECPAEAIIPLREAYVGANPKRAQEIDAHRAKSILQESLSLSLIEG